MLYFSPQKMGGGLTFPNITEMELEVQEPSSSCPWMQDSYMDESAKSEES